MRYRHWSKHKVSAGVLCLYEGYHDYIGAYIHPDMVVEILSPSTSRRDRFEKFLLYQRVGVREYWIVDPEAKIVQTYLLKDGQYTAYAYGDTGEAPVHVLEGCQILLPDVFAG